MHKIRTTDIRNSREGEVKLHSSFNKGTGYLQNCNSERGQLAELLPYSDSDDYSSTNSGKHVQLSGDSAIGLIHQSLRNDCRK